jgi:hypothetical protein
MYIKKIFFHVNHKNNSSDNYKSTITSIVQHGVRNGKADIISTKQHIASYLSRFNRGMLKKIPIIPMIIIFLQAISFVLNKLDLKQKFGRGHILLLAGNDNTLHLRLWIC